MALADYRVFWLFEVDSAYAAGLTNPQKLAIKTALEGTGIQDSGNPAVITAGRANVAKDAAIMEFSANNPLPPLGTIKNDAIQAVADALGVTFAEVDAVTTFTLFKDVGTPNLQVTWEESRQNAVAYLIANAAAWGEDVI